MSHNIAPITPGLRSQAEAEAVAKAILEATTGGRGVLPRLVAERSLATMASRL